MPREKLIKLSSTAVPLPIENIDTDQIIPARFLKATTREGFGDNLFRDWRYNQQNKPIKSFVLNDKTYKGSILIVGKNFGSGSSREHAAWAVYDYGFKIVISSFFADIFKANALNNGILPITVTAKNLEFIFSTIKKNPKEKFNVDVEKQTLSVAGKKITFDINKYKKSCLINGYDDIDYLLNLKEKIKKYEKKNEK